MARLQSMLGLFSGKLGGLVFTNSKSGQVVRKYVIPTNANSVAQQKNRSRFADSASVWAGITEGDKAKWNAYAASSYKAKVTKPGCTYSGFQALVGTFNTATQAQALKREATIAGPGTPTITLGDFKPTTDPLVGTFSGAIDDGAGKAVSQTMSNATLSAAGALTVAIELSSKLTATPDWTDIGSGRKHGYAFFGSMPNKPSANPYLTSLGTVGPLSSVSAFSTTTTVLNLSMVADDLSIDDKKLWYEAGNTVKISGFSVSERGEFQPIGSAVCTVS